jgi:hypothetical protein
MPSESSFAIDYRLPYCFGATCETLSASPPRVTTNLFWTFYRINCRGSGDVFILSHPWTTALHSDAGGCRPGGLGDSLREDKKAYSSALFLTADFHSNARDYEMSVFRQSPFVYFPGLLRRIRGGDIFRAPCRITIGSTRKSSTRGNRWCGFWSVYRGDCPEFPGLLPAVFFHAFSLLRSVSSSGRFLPNYPSAIAAF